MDTLLPSIHWTNLLIIPGLLIGYTVHELGHALMAYFLGDYSQVEYGKITLNPFEHISWPGFVFFLLFGVGWPKPLRANPLNFKRRYLDMFFVALSGPAASFMLSLIGLLLTLVIAASLVYVSQATTERVFLFLLPSFGLPSIFPFFFSTTTDLLQTLDVLQAWSIAFTGHIVVTSFWLTFFSLLPLPGLDGFAALTSLIAFFHERKQKEQQTDKQQPPLMMADQPITLISQRKRRNSAANIHFKVGVEYHHKNQYDDAIARYRQAVGNDQYFGPAYINMGLAYLAKSDRRKAIQSFRGAVQYADDQRSQSEAWYQLHQLSQISPIDEAAAQESIAEIGVSPWTDTKPRPNWLGLGISAFLLLAAGIFLYSYLFTNLVELLKTT